MKVVVAEKIAQADSEVDPACALRRRLVASGLLRIRLGGRAGFSRRARAGISTASCATCTRASEATSQPPSATSAKGAPGAAADGLIGRMEIPRLLLSVVVVEGISHNHPPARGRTYPRHGAAGRGRQRGTSRAPGHVFSPAEGFEDQGRDSVLDAERQFQVRSRVAKGGGAGQCRSTRSVRRERADDGDLLPFLLRRTGAQTVDREGQAGVTASGATIDCGMIMKGGRRRLATWEGA